MSKIRREVMAVGVALLGASTLAHAQTSSVYVEDRPCGGGSCATTPAMDEASRKAARLMELRMQFSKQVHDYSASASLVMAGTDTQKRMEANIALYEENIRGLSQLEGLAREIDALFADLYGERTGPGAADRIARSVSEFREMRADEQKLLEFERNSRTVELTFGSSQSAEPDFLAKAVSSDAAPPQLVKKQEASPFSPSAPEGRLVQGSNGEFAVVDDDGNEIFPMQHWGGTVVDYKGGLIKVREVWDVKEEFGERCDYETGRTGLDRTVYTNWFKSPQFWKNPENEIVQPAPDYYSLYYSTTQKNGGAFYDYYYSSSELTCQKHIVAQMKGEIERLENEGYEVVANHIPDHQMKRHPQAR